MSLNSTATARPFGYVSEIQHLINNPEQTAFIRERHADRYDLTPAYIRSFSPVNARSFADREQPTSGAFSVGYETIYGVQSTVTVTVSEDGTSFVPPTPTSINHNGRALYVADPTAESFPVTPVFGTQYNIGFIVQDEVTSADTVKDIERLLRDYFGTQLRLGRIKSREVPEEFFKVGRFGSDTEIANSTPVLGAEIAYIGDLGGAYTKLDTPTPKYLAPEPFAAQSAEATA